MTEETLAGFRARLAAGKPAAPLPTTAPSQADNRLDPVLAETVSRLDPATQATMAPLLARAHEKAGAEALGNIREVATKQQEERAKEAPVTLGEALEFTPEDVVQWGSPEVAHTLEELKGKVPTTGVHSSPFGSEWGQQAFGQLRQIPLQRMTGALGMAPTAQENRLAALHFMRLAKREKAPPINKMEPDQFADLKARAEELARRDMASVLGASEQRGNAVIDTRTPEEQNLSIRRGEDLPAPLYAAPIGGAIAGMHLREYLLGTPVEDQAMMNLLSPFLALMRPGAASADVEQGVGVPNAARESKLHWIARLGPSSAWASWAFDPSMSWELGGENGFGGKRHIDKIRAGYDVTEDLRTLGEAYDKATPWESGRIEKTLAAAIPIGAIVLSDPDALSIGTGLVAAPIAKAAGLSKVGTLVLENLFEPMLKEWETAYKAGASLEDINAKAIEGGTVSRVLWKAIGADTMMRIVEGQDPRIQSRLANEINASRLTGIPEATAKAEERVSEAAGKIRDAVREGSESVREAQVGARELLKAAQSTGDQALAQHAVRAAKAVQDATNERVLLAEAEDRLIHGTILKEMPKPLVSGQRAVDLATQEDVVIQSFHLGKKVTAMVRRPNGRIGRIPLSQIARRGEPGSDTMTVFRALQSNKRRYDSVLKQIQAATDMGDAEGVARLNKQLLNIKSGMIDNISDLEYASLRAGYASAKKAAQEALAFSERVGAEGHLLRSDVNEAVREAVQGGRAAVDKALNESQDRLRKLAEGHDFERAHLAALKASRDRLGDTLGRYRRAVDAFKVAAKAGATEAAPLRASVLDSVAKRVRTGFVLDGDAYRAALDAKYGAEVVEKTLGSALGSGVRPLLRGGTMPIEAHALLRKFEEGIASAADLERRMTFQPIKGALTTLATATPWQAPTSVEGVIAFTFQLASTAGRWTDKITAGALGKAPKVVREAGRRAFQRLQSIEQEQGHVAGKYGLAAVEEMMTSTRSFPGVVSNRDPMTHADRAVAYLRALARTGDDALWSNDLVVKAISRAPMAPGDVADVAAPAAVSALRKLVLDPTTTGVGMWEWAKKGPPAIFAQQSGRTDTDEVVLRFLARAVAQGSNQHDTMFDLMRVTGAHLTADSANALSYMAKPQAGKLSQIGAATAEDAYRVMAAYGVPQASFTKGAVEKAFTTVDKANALWKVADIDGYGHYVPGHIWDALNALPHNLAKEMREWNETNRALGAFDRLARTWRIAAVNGWLVPRAAHFVNTFLGDWSQLTTSFGWRTGARLSINNAAPYLPFVGTRLQDRLAAGARKNSILGALFNPDLQAVLKAEGKHVVETLEGPLIDHAFLQEARVDGVWDSINTKELMEITARRQRSWWSKWNPVGGDAPPHIEATARMLEEAQYRSRLLLYLEARTGRLTGKPMSRAEAKAALVDALYDWKTGVPDWEQQLIGRIAAFWTYRRGMARQLGATITESLSAPGTEYWAKALSGRTRLARMRQTAQIAGGVPEAIYWDDPTQPMDDEEQLDALGRREAPWYVKSQSLLGSRQVDGERKLWYSEVAGREVTYESFLLPALTAMDQLWLLHLFVQTSAATTTMLAEQAGLSRGRTTVGPGELWNRNVDALSDQLMPVFDDAVNGMLRPLLGEAKHRSDKGVAVPIAQAVLLRRLGFEDFLAAHPDPDGQIRVDSTVLGFVQNLLMNAPQVADVSRNWLVLDNPGMQESWTNGLTEGLARWTGLGKPSGHDPFGSRDYEAQDKERTLKHKASQLEAQTTRR